MAIEQTAVVRAQSDDPLTGWPSTEFASRALSFGHDGSVSHVIPTLPLPPTHTGAHPG